MNRLRTALTAGLPLLSPAGGPAVLAVADLNGDGRPDIIVNEQEELLPEGRQNPRWIAWINEGGEKFTEQILLDGKLHVDFLENLQKSR